MTIGKASASEGPEKSARRKPQQRGLRSARKLLDTAAALFVEKGVEHTTVDEIVAQAGVAKGTFYHHFDSKTSLLIALRENVVDLFQLHVEAAVNASPTHDPSRRLDAWIISVCEGYVRMEPLHDIVFGQRDEFPRWSVTGRPFMQTLVALLEQGNREELWRVRNPGITATFIFMGLHGVIDDMILAGADPIGDLPEILALVHDMLRPHVPPGSATRPAVSKRAVKR